MGQALSAGAQAAGIQFVTLIDEGIPLPSDFGGAEVAIDFSVPAATAQLVETALRARKSVVIGTTGHSPEQLDYIRTAAKEIPIVLAGNFSIGVNLLFVLARQAARALGSDYDAELIEMHHHHKKDSPSGTAVRLLEIVEEERGLTAANRKAGRDGWVGPRPQNEIGVHAVRGGDIVGEHILMFAGIGERLELKHQATDRSIFARGALHAARWLVNQSAGLYDMEDVLQLS
jgi:4-hydroxy-tetrahydrodipicolinate reductase